MRKKIVAGNWKMNTTPQEGVNLVREILEGVGEISSDVKVVIAPPFTHLSTIKKEIEDSSIVLAAQNCADHLNGAFTGEISAPMLKAVGCECVIIGHSERREYYGENEETLVKKLNILLEADLIPIYCVGEKLSEREDKRHFAVVEAQIKSVLFGLSDSDMQKVVIAYEPVWAIGTGKTATPEEAQEMHQFIRSVLSDKFGDISQDISILYGGSMNVSNAETLISQPDIDGGLIGGASLKGGDFVKIIQSCI